MDDSLSSRLKKAWNVFVGNEDKILNPIGNSYSVRPDRPKLSRGTERTLTNSVYNRIALDVASIQFQHVRLDDNNRFLTTIDSGLNNCLNLEANIDQTSRAFIHDCVLSMFDEGCVALVPIDTDRDLLKGTVDIYSIRTGKIVEWYPRHVRVRVYDDRTGLHKELILPKTTVAIVENPFYSVMNERNSTVQRLIRKLALLDRVDEESSSGKLDLIIQLPYVIKTAHKQEEAERRRKQIEEQLTSSKYGVAYTDGTEKIVQLNRSLENNLIHQIEYLHKIFYSQLGLTEEIMNGSASEEVMLNYNDRTIEPIASAIASAMKRTFLSKTARTQKQSIEFFRDPFKLVPVSELAEIADKFTRNEIMTSNEIRQIVGMRPSMDPAADELRNKNLSQPSGSEETAIQGSEITPEQFEASMAVVDGVDEELMSLKNELQQAETDEDYLEHRSYASPYYDPVKAHEYYERTKELKGRNKRSPIVPVTAEKGKPSQTETPAATVKRTAPSVSSTPTKRETVSSTTTTTSNGKKLTTSGLNTEGKAIAKSIKEDLTAEKKQLTEESKLSTEARIEQIRAETASKIEGLGVELDANTEAYRVRIQGKIDVLRDKLEGMSSLLKRLNEEKISKEIDALLLDNKNERIRLTNEYRASSASLRTEQQTESASVRESHRNKVSSLKADYDQKYQNELERLHADDRYTTKNTTSSNSSSSGRSSSSGSSSNSSQKTTSLPKVTRTDTSSSSSSKKSGTNKVIDQRKNTYKKLKR